MTGGHSDEDYAPDPNRQSLTPSVAEFFGVLGEATLSAAWGILSAAWRIAKALLIGAGVLLLLAGLFVFISSAVAVGVSSAQ